jgi:hypothetical protein
MSMLRGAERSWNPTRRGTFVARVLPLIPVLLAASATSFAEVSPQSVTACTTLRKAGSYEIDSSLTASGSADCIEIAASDVVLTLNGWTMVGGGGGVGVHILRTSANAYVEGRGAIISGFAEGIEIDSTSAVLENFTVSSNSGAGVYLDNARQAKVANFITSGNLDGVEINSGTGNIVQSATATSNTRYGFWLDSTTYNAIGGFEAADNEMAGVYIGCSLTGPQGAKCPVKVKPSDYNSIFDGSAVRNSAGVQAFGIAIDLGNSNNRVSGVMASFNSQTDAVDDNPDCGDNIWIAITEGSTNQAFGCIP